MNYSRLNERMIGRYVVTWLSNVARWCVVCAVYVCTARRSSRGYSLNLRSKEYGRVRRVRLENCEFWVRLARGRASSGECAGELASSSSSITKTPIRCEAENQRVRESSTEFSRAIKSFPSSTRQYSCLKIHLDIVCAAFGCCGCGRPFHINNITSSRLFN